MGLSSLTVEGVSLRYGAAMALQEINLHVPSGEFVAIVGPSGSGKTSLLNVVSGIQLPSSGFVRIGGRDVTKEPIYGRNIGVVFQGYALFPHMSAYENVSFPLRVGRHRIGKDLVEERVGGVFAAVGLEGLEKRRVNQLSGGQQQRVALARALVFDPEILLLDEPLAALDRGLRADLQYEIRSLQRRLGITTLFVTHDIEEAMAMAERIVILRNGRVEQDGVPREVYEYPTNVFVASMLGTANVASGRVQGLGEAISIIGVREYELKVPRIASISVGDSVSIMVRPENIALHSVCCGPAKEMNRLPARVRGWAYLGPTCRLDLEVAGEFHWKVIVPSGEGEQYMNLRDIDVSWAPLDTRILTQGDML